MTNTNNKCKGISCTHSASFAERYQINPNGGISLKHGQKWHFCNTCDKVFHLSYIYYHEMKCTAFHKMRENCITKNHTHSNAIACNL